MSYLIGKYSPSRGEYGITGNSSTSYAFIESTEWDGAFYLSNITVYDDQDKSKKLFSFCVGTLDETEESIFSASIASYLEGFIVGGVDD